MNDDDNIVDLQKHREELRQALVIEKTEGPPQLTCSECGDTLFWVVPVPDMEALAIICQHCQEPLGYGFEFVEEEEGA